MRGVSATGAALTDTETSCDNTHKEKSRILSRSLERGGWASSEI